MRTSQDWLRITSFACTLRTLANFSFRASLQIATLIYVVRLESRQTPRKTSVMRELQLSPRQGRLLASLLACTVCYALATATFLSAQTARPAGWVESTHGRQTAPDYSRLFAMDKVHELNI